MNRFEGRPHNARGSDGMNAVLTAKGISQRFGAHQELDGADVDVEFGENP